MKQIAGFFKKAADFAQDKGFYIILALCAVAIGISGYVLFFTGSEPADIPQPSTAVSAQDTLQIPAESKHDEQTVEHETQQDTVPVPQQQDVPLEPPEIPDQTQQTDTVKQESEAKPAGKPANIAVKIKRFTVPMKTDVVREFSGQQLVYDETMGDWRTHGGTDFACTEGEQVFAVADGEISAIYSDEQWGNCVSISHAEGVVSTYCGLVENATLSIGMAVQAGDVIGGAGGGIPCENAQPLHIHVAVTRNGESIDLVSLF